MFTVPGKLSAKILRMLFGFFAVAAVAIGLTLMLSWQLEGVAAAINDAGSQRMRSYILAHLMSQELDKPTASKRLGEEVARFDQVLAELGNGDPKRPLSPPRNPEVRRSLDAVGATWAEQMRPLVLAYLQAESGQRHDLLARYDQALEPFVGQINDLVLTMEGSYARDTTLLRTVQGLLVLMAVIGTIILVRFFFQLVIRPVTRLHEGLRRMTSRELSYRLPVETDDELGGLARGFNQMGEQLQGVYSTLEERVAAETRSLEERNHELALLYEITAFFSEPMPLEALCEGFLERVKRALGADAGAVRLYMPDSHKLYLVTHEGLSEDFLKRERELNCGECLCGDVIQNGYPAVFNTINPPPGMKLGSCIREGFATATAFSIMHGKHRLGVYNLYFLKTHPVSTQGKHLLETLGQHLGVAVENTRFRSREKELAVSEERNLLAQELHDSIAQGLAFLNIQVQMLQDSLRQGAVADAQEVAGQLREGVQESYDDVRELLVHFRTRVHQSDLDTAISAALEKFEGQTGIATRFEAIGNGLPLAATDEIQIMHIVQESLSNIRKHAKASNVAVTVRRQGGQTQVTVRDNGVGFDPETNPSVLSDRHVGLKIMRERAHRVGAECQITSRPGGGTQVSLTLAA